MARLLELTAERDAEPSPGIASYRLSPPTPAGTVGWVRLSLRFHGRPRVAPIVQIRGTETGGFFDATALCSEVRGGRSTAVFRLHGESDQLRIRFPEGNPEARVLSGKLQTIGPGRALTGLARAIGTSSVAGAVAPVLAQVRAGAPSAIRMPGLGGIFGGGRLGSLIRRGVPGAKLAIRRALEAAEYAEAYRRWTEYFPETHPVAGSGASMKVALIEGASSTFSEEAQWAVFLEPGDRLSPDAFEQVARAATSHPDAKIIYGDEDLLAPGGRRSSPNFKPDWNLDYFLSRNLLSRLVAYRADLLRSIGALKRGVDSRPWDYELAARAIFEGPVAASEIVHIPRVLYHRATPRMGLGQAFEPSAEEARATRAVFAAHVPGARFEPGLRGGNHARYAIPAPAPLVTAIICTRDRVELLRTVVEGLRHPTRYPSLELVIVDNQSSDRETLEYLAKLESGGRATVVRFDRPFDFAAMNNLGARKGTGSVLAFLNNDLKILSEGWLGELVAHALRVDVGAVGAKLKFEDGHIQHAGVALGLGFGAGHPMRGFPPEGRDPWARLFAAQRMSAVTAACLVMRREVFERVGGFDEIFPVAFNDVDLCLKVQELGLGVVWTPFAELTHLESASRGMDAGGEKLVRLAGESARLRARYGQKLGHDPYFNPNWALDSEPGLPSFPPRI